MNSRNDVAHRRPDQVARYTLIASDLGGHTKVVAGWLIRLVIPTLFIVVLSGCGDPVSPDGANTPTSMPGVVGHGTTAPWAEQLSVAQTSAAKIDPNATLVDILASPKGAVAGTWDYSSAFGVSFTFLSASGDRTVVSIDDTSPATSVATIKYPKTTDAAYQQLTPNEVQQALAQIAISPREAGRITWGDALTQTKLQGAKVRPLIGIDLSHKPVAWFVQYEPASEVFTGIQDPVTVYVDARKGEVIQRNGGAPAP